MDEAVGTRYWCHMCSQMVRPVMELDIKCPSCESGFIEEVEASNTRDVNQGFNGGDGDGDGASDSDPALSLWAPILMGMMSKVGVRPSHRVVTVELVTRTDGGEENQEGRERQEQGERGAEQEGGDEMNDRRRRRSSVAILQMMQDIRNQMEADEENRESALMDSDAQNGNEGNGQRAENRQRGVRERVMLINPFNHTIIVQGSYNASEDHGPGGEGQARNIGGSLGDYFVGPSLDMLLQHLAENDPNRYGTPPAKKEAVEAMPTVRIEENVLCSVCLDDLEIGAEAKEMPCKHKFHDGCIMPWLELHSSCPVCRHQLPADESKIGASRRDNNNTDGNNINNSQNNGEDGNNRDAVRVSIPWPFNVLFSFAGTTTASNSSSSDNAGSGDDNSHEGQS